MCSGIAQIEGESAVAVVVVGLRGLNKVIARLPVRSPVWISDPWDTVQVVQLHRQNAWAPID